MRSLVNRLIRFRSIRQVQLSDIPKRFLSSAVFTRKDISIPVPITGGHLAAQLWETPLSSTSTLPPVICMHGYQDNSCSFDPLIPLLIKNGMTFISVDQPGHGLSSHLSGAGPDFVLDGVATIHRVIRHFEWDKVILLAHSYGSILSFVFTATNPDIVHKYIAIENLHAISREPNAVTRRTISNLFSVESKITDPNKVQPSYTFDDIVQRTYRARRETVTEEGVRILLRRGAQPDPNDSKRFRFTHDLKTNISSAFARFSYEESLQLAENIKCPVCVIKGDPGEDYEPRENFMRMVEAIRTANEGKLTFHLVPGTHHVHLNEPEKIAPLISEFLESEPNL